MGKGVKKVESKRNDRMERCFEVKTRAVEAEGQEGQKELYVEGYAVRFNSPTVLFEMGGVEYKEQIDRHAFDEAEMDDVIFNYNHGGKVMARTRNGTLELKVDDDGLFIRARLDGTEEGRRLYDTSAVDIPAYDDTSIAARRAAVEKAAGERKASLELMKRRVTLKCKI